MKCNYLSCWSWICLLFAAQTIGSLGIARLFQMDLREIVIPVMILSAGTIVSAVFRAVSEAGRLGKWQWWVPALIDALFIFSLSNRAYPDSQPIFSTKVFHPIEYPVLGVFISLALLPALREKGLPSMFKSSRRTVSRGLPAISLETIRRNGAPAMTKRSDPYTVQFAKRLTYPRQLSI